MGCSGWLVVTLDGEDVVDCEPVIGYLHRGMEKIAESRTNVMFVPYDGKT